MSKNSQKKMLCVRKLHPFFSLSPLLKLIDNNSDKNNMRRKIASVAMRVIVEINWIVMLKYVSAYSHLFAFNQKILSFYEIIKNEVKKIPLWCIQSLYHVEWIDDYILTCNKKCVYTLKLLYQQELIWRNHGGVRLLLEFANFSF